MKFQLALDDIDLDKALSLILEMNPYVDIIEVGTPLLMEHGIEAIRLLKKTFPDKEVLCDAKIMDAGGYEAALCYEAGADYVTVLGVTDILTIKECVQTAKKYNGKVVADMICVKDFPGRIASFEEVGVDIIAVHTGVDQQAKGVTPLDDFIAIKKWVSACKIAVAGGIGSQTIGAYLPYHPDIVIVGGSVIKAEDPVAEITAFVKQMKEAE
ncbi:3-hexulose-6-phosphate synthase [Lachnospiraceae bacterium PM6-15]|uniref:3-hexulose-6-phosphate synthase n=1 Tax=Ohessyouella blattaphilus TaxID=2949333 RepID=UPI003E3049FC